MTYEERLEKLNTLDDFINGENQDDILLVLDKNYSIDVWSIICAVRHWFSVVEQYLDSDNILKNNTNDNNWGNVYLYITAVDIVTKGINDLYKVLQNDYREDSKKRLFFGDKDIFQDSEKDDNRYFQNTRAIFGAHPTTLDANKDFIVATYPTPCNNRIKLHNEKENDWDYYTLLWSREKTDGFLQKEVGFSFKKIDNYLDKHIDYLNTFINEIMKMILEYKEKIANDPIVLPEDIIERLRILKEEDNKRLKGRYEYIIDDLVTLLGTKIDNISNSKTYMLFKERIVNRLRLLEQAVQMPNKNHGIDELKDVIYSANVKYDDYSHYYYSKLIEYDRNIGMETVLIDYYKNKLKYFNSDIHNIRELFCLVQAENYFLNRKEEM